MAGHRERVLEFLASFPGRDDDEIASALKIAPRQTVNMVCRKLGEEGLIRRELGLRGKLINFITPGPVAAMPSQELPLKPVNAADMTEDQVKTALAKMLEMAGWSMQIAWGRARGIDIDATRGPERWLIECKGTGSSAPMQNNYFLGVIGELLQRMHDDSAKHSIAFPDLPKYRRPWSELPSNVKRRLQLTALFVGCDGEVHELSS